MSLNNKHNADKKIYHIVDNIGQQKKIAENMVKYSFRRHVQLYPLAAFVGLGIAGALFLGGYKMLNDPHIRRQRDNKQENVPVNTRSGTLGKS